MSETSEQKYYANAHTVLDLSLPAVLKVYSELEDLQPAKDQIQLPTILSRAGQQFETSYRDFPNVVANEQVIEEELTGTEGRVRRAYQHDFSYLILLHHNQSSAKVEEYRANAEGARIAPIESVGGLQYTEGFAGVWALFYPGNQSASNFRLLGRQSLNGRDTYVVAFAQRPGWSEVVGRLNWGGRSVVLLYQGLAWIDSRDYRILRVRLDLLTPRLDILLERQTTEIQYGESHVAGTTAALWLAQHVTVTTVWNGRVLRNRHTYSNYRRFVVQSTIKPVEWERPIAAPQPR